MNGIFIIYILLSNPLILLSTKSDANPKMNFLSFSYAKFVQENPGGNENLADDERQLHISIALALTNAGSRYAALGKNKEAIERYEEALSHYATSELYFEYGNALFNIDSFEKAIQAYKIAAALGYEMSNLIYYNIACAYSRLENKRMAFLYLEVAIMDGYKNEDGITQSRHLEYLRSLPEWKMWFIERKAFLKPTPFPEEGLVVEFSFNGNANDNSGNDNHGTVYGAILTKDRYGNLDSAYYFDGTNDYVKIGNLHSISESNEVTISYWFYLEGHSGYDICGYLAATDNALRLGLDPDRHIFINAGTHTDVSSNAVTFDIDTWYHYVMSVKGGDVARVYVNGKMVFETTSGVPDNLKEPPCFAVGASDETILDGGMCHHVQGIIDDFRIYSRVLSNADIKELHHEGKANDR